MPLNVTVSRGQGRGNVISHGRRPTRTERDSRKASRAQNPKAHKDMTDEERVQQLIDDSPLLDLMILEGDEDMPIMSTPIVFEEDGPGNSTRRFEFNLDRD